MSILTGPEIVKQMDEGEIIITPFDPELVNPNSVDLRLADTLLMYQEIVLDARKDNETRTVIIPKEGMILHPGILYLGSTVEWTATYQHVPTINGKSSLARLGLSVHQTAGFGDVGFVGTWTLELMAIHPIRIYPRMRICQIAYQTIHGKVQEYCGKYQQQSGPVASRFWQGE